MGGVAAGGLPAPPGFSGSGPPDGNRQVAVVASKEPADLVAFVSLREGRVGFRERGPRCRLSYLSSFLFVIIYDSGIIYHCFSNYLSLLSFVHFFEGLAGLSFWYCFDLHLCLNPFALLLNPLFGWLQRFSGVLPLMRF